MSEQDRTFQVIDAKEANALWTMTLQEIGYDPFEDNQEDNTPIGDPFHAKVFKKSLSTVRVGSTLTGNLKESEYNGKTEYIFFPSKRGSNAPKPQAPSQNTNGYAKRPYGANSGQNKDKYEKDGANIAAQVILKAAIEQFGREKSLDSKGTADSRLEELGHACTRVYQDAYKALKGDE